MVYAPDPVGPKSAAKPGPTKISHAIRSWVGVWPPPGGGPLSVVGAVTAATGRSPTAAWHGSFTPRRAGLTLTGLIGIGVAVWALEGADVPDGEGGAEVMPVVFRAAPAVSTTRASPEPVARGGGTAAAGPGSPAATLAAPASRASSITMPAPIDAAVAGLGLPAARTDRPAPHAMNEAVSQAHPVDVAKVVPQAPPQAAVKQEAVVAHRAAVAARASPPPVRAQTQAPLKALEPTLAQCTEKIQALGLCTLSP